MADAPAQPGEAITAEQLAILAGAARQYALTSRLLGVDFVPHYGTVPTLPGAMPVAETTPAPAAARVRGIAARNVDFARSDTDESVKARKPAPPVEHPAAEAVRPEPIAVPASVPRVEPSSRPSIPPQAADAAQADLDAICARYTADAPHASFNTTFTNIVFGEGSPTARLMFIGEAPGATEDQTGRPFMGDAGSLLDKMIVAMGTLRQDVYITNVLKTRPPGNATPTADEAELCAAYLYDQIIAVRPTVIVTLGLPATRLILQSESSMGALRGIWASWRHPSQAASYDPGTAASFVADVMPTYHPAFLLRSYTPDNRSKVWADLKKAAERLGLKAKA